MEIANSNPIILTVIFLILLCVLVITMVWMVNNKLKDLVEKKFYDLEIEIRTQHDSIVKLEQNMRNSPILRDNIKVLPKEYEELRSDFRELVKELNQDLSQLNSKIKTLENICKINDSFENYSERNDHSYSPEEIQFADIDIIQTENEYQRKYIEMPEKEGFFLVKNLKDHKDPRSVYEIQININTKNGYFNIIKSPEAFSSALDNPKIKLKPACDYNKEPSPETHSIIVDPNVVGKFNIDGDKLQISAKLKISFA